MLTQRPRALAALLLSLLAVTACGDAGADPDLVLHNGRFFTIDPNQPWAEAVLIRGDRIVQVGTSGDILAAASPGATLVDLEGRVVIPGLNDAHAHIMPELPGTRVAMSDNPTADPPAALVLDSLRAAVARTPAGEWISITISNAVLGDAQARRAALDGLAPDHPVMLRAWSGHGTILNSAALTALGVDEAVADPLGGRFERAAAGRLTGRLEEYAEFNLMSRMPWLADTGAIAVAYRGFAGMMARWGVTSVQNFVSGVEPAALNALLPSLDLPIRIRMVPWPMTTPGGREMASWTNLQAPGGGMVTVSGVKYVLDGTPIERLAALRQPYQDHGSSGRINFPADTIRALLADALARNQQPLLHAIGDSTIAVLLNLMLDIAPEERWQQLRPRIEHGDFLSPDLIPLARRLGVVVVQNPSHFTIVPEFMARVDGARRAWAQPVRSLLESGVVMALGSDGPPNPFLNIMLAAMHPVNPAEALTVAQLVGLYTRGSAYAEFAETERGSIMAGMLADLAVLSQDIFTVPLEALPGTESVLTLVGGRAVWDPMGWVGAGQEP